MEPIKPTNKKVHVKLDEDNARILFEIVHKSVKDIYSGDDWNERSTVAERTRSAVLWWKLKSGTRLY